MTIQQHASLFVVGFLGIGLSVAQAATQQQVDGSKLLNDIVSSASPVLTRWDLNADEISLLARAVQAHMGKALDASAASIKNPSWSATMQPLVDNDATSSLIYSVCTFPSYVSPNATTRDASAEADTALSAYFVDAAAREDVYLAVKAFNGTAEAKALTGERKRYLASTLRDFKRAGLGLPQATRGKVTSLLQKIAALGIRFESCLTEDSTKLSFTKAQLEGVPDDYFEGRDKDPKDASKYIVTMKTPDYLPVMQRCKVDATRKAVDRAYSSVCITNNTAIMDELVSLRHQAATLLGYPNWSAYQLEINMAKSPDTVKAMYNDLTAKLNPLQAKEMGVLLALKKQEKAQRNESFDGKINTWDVPYYQQQVQLRYFDVDKQLIKQYFPVETVTTSLLNIYQNMLGLRFEEDAQLSKAAWHPDVKAYKVYNRPSGKLIGYFYMDLHPRDGKYGHAAMFPLQPGMQFPGAKSGDGRTIAGAALVTNFPKPTKEQPNALMLHEDVVTMFHEFGHVMHELCSRTDLKYFAGTNGVESDFVEAPSQVLENWVWNEATLKCMSKHYKTGEPMDDALVKKLVASRNANGGMLNKRQIALGLFDQIIHTSAKADTRRVYADVVKRVQGYDIQPGTNYAARFAHLASGYDAQYYSYLWSKVFAADMFETRFLKEGINNPQTGTDYRADILQPGGTRDANDMLRTFLGREPNNAAFLRSLGLK